MTSLRNAAARTLLLIGLLILIGYVSLFAVGFFLLGDPGYTFRPTDARGRPIARWSQTIDGVSLNGEYYETLSGEDSAMYEVNLINKSDKTVTVLGGEFSTKRLTLKADLPSGSRRVFPPGSSGEVVLNCDYGGGKRDSSAVLGESLRWVWRLRIGDQERTFEVRMIRGR
jgi:hypothetical protein